MDYSQTASSQNTASIENSTWHSMKADRENISNSTAKARGQEFGWDKIFEASEMAKEVGGIQNLKKNSTGIQALGLGLHALQDAVAHQGTDMDHHNTWNDMHPSKAVYDKASNVTEGALLVTEIMSGNNTYLQNGMSISIDGMSSSQLQKFTTTLSNLMNTKEGVQKITIINQR